MPSNGTLLYWSIRALLAASTGGASEGAFIAGDVMGAAFATAELFTALDTAMASGDSLESVIRCAVLDGKITGAEAAEILNGAREFGTDMYDLHEAKQHLKQELRGHRVVSGDHVLHAARRVRCSICRAEGVNKSSHRRGHRLAHKHYF